MKTCSKCKLDKELFEFNKQKHAPDGHTYVCKKCNSLTSVAQRKRKGSAFTRETNLYKKYGLSVLEYTAMLDAQGGVCKICGKTANPLEVDHDHKTGAVRGLLCLSCNLAVGFMQDDPAIMRRAACYIEEAPKATIADTLRLIDQGE